MESKSLYDILLERGFSQSEINQFLKTKEMGLIIPRDVQDVDIIRNFRTFCIKAKCEDSFQKQKLILNGLLNNLDVSKYAKPEYDVPFMNQIFIGLSNGLDITEYCTKEDGFKIAEAIRLALMNGVTDKEKLNFLKTFKEYRISYDFIDEIRYCIEKDIDLNKIKTCTTIQELKALRKK